MLYTETVATETLDLLKAIQSQEEFKSLRLVGGTSLALQYGHRLSIDLDFFGDLNIEDEELLAILHQIGPTRPLKLSKLIKAVMCCDVKVDFVHFHYPWISEPIHFEGMVLASDQDIAAMKISAITGRGSKKDFFDLHELLKRYELKEIIQWYEAKYADGSTFLALKSLIYFDDANEQEDPVSLNKTSWEQVKASISEAYQKYMKE